MTVDHNYGASNISNEASEKDHNGENSTCFVYFDTKKDIMLKKNKKSNL